MTVRETPATPSTPTYSSASSRGVRRGPPSPLGTSTTRKQYRCLHNLPPRRTSTRFHQPGLRWIYAAASFGCLVALATTGHWLLVAYLAAAFVWLPIMFLENGAVRATSANLCGFVLGTGLLGSVFLAVFAVIGPTGLEARTVRVPASSTLSPAPVRA